MLNRRIRGFGAILFVMVPKDKEKRGRERGSFGTILFDMLPKE